MRKPSRSNTGTRDPRETGNIWMQVGKKDTEQRAHLLEHSNQPLWVETRTWIFPGNKGIKLRWSCRLNAWCRLVRGPNQTWGPHSPPPTLDSAHVAFPLRPPVQNLRYVRRPRRCSSTALRPVPISDCWQGAGGTAHSAVPDWPGCVTGVLERGESWAPSQGHRVCDTAAVAAPTSLPSAFPTAALRPGRCRDMTPRPGRGPTGAWGRPAPAAAAASGPGPPRPAAPASSRHVQRSLSGSAATVHRPPALPVRAGERALPGHSAAWAGPERPLQGGGRRAWSEAPCPG